MNNRKQTNKRGKNPRGAFIQVIQEPKTLTKTVLGVHKQIPNPRAGTKTVIRHRPN